QTLRKYWKFDFNNWNSFEVSVSSIKKKKKNEEYKLNESKIEHNPIYNTEFFSCLPIPEVIIYYERYLIKCGTKIKEKNNYFAIYHTRNVPSSDYTKIIKIIKKIMSK
ncbi:hypothetical protein LCGC14_2815100, partial [marine sediment metagenome]